MEAFGRRHLPLEIFERVRLFVRGLFVRDSSQYDFIICGSVRRGLVPWHGGCGEPEG